MQSTVDFLLTDHAAWSETPDRKVRIFATTPETLWLATLQGRRLSVEILRGTGPKPVADSFALSKDLGISELTKELRALGPVGRFRTTDLWEALGTSIIRQVIRAAQAKKLYRNFCAAHGEQIELPDGSRYSLFPTAEAVLELSDDTFAARGMAFKRRPLKAAAEAYMEFGSKWQGMDLQALISELQRVPGIGPWTAQATVADWSNDWSHYPYSDLAVRTWAKTATPTVSWPADEPTFGRIWRELAGDELNSLTLLTLAWGAKYAASR